MYGQVAYSFHTLGEYEAALYYYKKQLQLAWDRGDQNIETDIYDNIGMEYYYLGNLEKSTYYHNASMNGGVKLGRILSLKAKENPTNGLVPEFMRKAAAAGVKSIHEQLIDHSQEMRRYSKIAQKLAYIKERDFNEELTRASIKVIKHKLQKNRLPSPRMIEMRTLSTCTFNSGLEGILPKITSPSKEFSYL